MLSMFMAICLAKVYRDPGTLTDTRLPR